MGNKPSLRPPMEDSSSSSGSVISTSNSNKEDRLIDYGDVTNFPKMDLDNQQDWDSSADDEAVVKEAVQVVVEGGEDNGTAGSSGTELLAAASEGRGDTAMQILKACPDLIQIRDPAGNTILHVAARSGHMDTLMKLLDFVSGRCLIYSMLESGNGHGDTPLHLAIKSGHEKAADVLVWKYDEVLYVKNKEGVTPSYLAKKAGYRFAIPHALFVDMEEELLMQDLEGEDKSTEFFKLLLAIEKGHGNEALNIMGANPELLRRELGGTKGTALHMAARHGRVHILRAMIGLIVTTSKSDGRLTMRLLLDGNKFGDTPLHLAIKGGHQKAALELIKATPKAAYLVNDNGVSPLYVAVKAGYLEIVKHVFRVKPMASLSQSRRYTLLGNNNTSLAHAAVDSKNLGMLQEILGHVPSLIDSIDEKGWKPLSYAAYKGNLEGVNYLLQKFPEYVKKCDQDGSFPIHKAVGGGHVSIVKEFISRCPQTIFDVDRKQRSVLHIAVLSTKPDILSYLIKETEAGMKLFNFKDHKGRTFMDLAKELTSSKKLTSRSVLSMMTSRFK